MTVLIIVGFIVGMIGLYLVFEYLNDVSMKNYSYEFFSIGHLIQVMIGYWIIFFGNNIYMKAAKASGDLLNGQLLIAIGVVVVLIVVYKNFKAVPFLVALAFTILELIICAPLAVGAFFILVIAAAALAETKPVYVLNN